MKFSSLAGVALLCFASTGVGRVVAADPVPNADLLAQVYDQQITRADADAAITKNAARTAADYVGSVIGVSIYKQFAREEKLEVTPEECDQLDRFMAESNANHLRQAREDITRTRQELSSTTLSPEKRTELTERLKTFEKFHENMQNAVDHPGASATNRKSDERWIIGYKTSRQLYEKFGGQVEVTKFGPRPIGAEKALLEREIAAGKIVIPDPGLKAKIYSAFTVRPGYEAKPNEIDFTYYWTRPVTTSPH